MTRLNPITEQQFSELFTGIEAEDNDARPVRFVFRNGGASLGTVNLVTGIIHDEHDAVVYYERPEEWVRTALRALRSNNPSDRIEAEYE